MEKEPWFKHQEQVFSTGHFGVTEKEDKAHPSHYLRTIQEDTLIKRGEFILDLGCNDGTHTNRFYSEGYEAFGCDLPKVIERAREKYPQIAQRLFCCNLDKDAVPSVPMHSWDLIFAKAVIEHFEFWKELPEKMYKTQGTGDMIWIATNNGSLSPNAEAHHFVHIPFLTLAQIFKDAGYTVVKHYVDPLGDKCQILVGRRE